MSFTIQRILAIVFVVVLGLLFLTPEPGLAQVAKPDLVVNSLVSPPGEALPGDSFVVTAEVKNLGPGAAGASLTKFFLVPATGPNKKNLKGAQTVGPLGPGASEAPSATVAIYSDTVPGTYSLQACADGDTSVGEGNDVEQLSDRAREDHCPRRAGPRDEDDQRAATAGAAGAGLRRDL